MRGPEELAIFGWQRLRVAVAVADHVRRLAGGQALTGCVVEYFIGKAQGARAGLSDASADAQEIVVTRRTQVAAVRLGYHNVAVVFQLHLLVGKPQLPEQLDAPHFKPDEEIRVVHHAELVRFGVAHASSRSISSSAKRHSSRLVRARLVGLAATSAAASSRAMSINSSRETTSVTRPMRCASSASKMRPVSSKSRARFSPIWRIKNTDTIAGMKPMRTSV